MISIRDYDGILRKVAQDFLVFNVHYVHDLTSWAKQKDVTLSEPYQPLKLLPADNKLMLFVQEDVEEESLEKVVRALGVRWSLRDNLSNPVLRLNSAKKRIVYCFFKEYARSLHGVGGDELLEDDYAMREMESAGFFNE